MTSNVCLIIIDDHDDIYYYTMLQEEKNKLVDFYNKFQWPNELEGHNYHRDCGIIFKNLTNEELKKVEQIYSAQEVIEYHDYNYDLTTISQFDNANKN